MPPRTTAYLIWRGTPAGDPRKANSLLALWDDPDFAPVRAAMFENVTSTADKDSAKQALTREEAEQYSTLLENCFRCRLHHQARSENDRQRDASEALGQYLERVVLRLRSHRQGELAQQSRPPHARPGKGVAEALRGYRRRRSGAQSRAHFGNDLLGGTRKIRGQRQRTSGAGRNPPPPGRKIRRRRIPGPVRSLQGSVSHSSAEA